MNKKNVLYVPKQQYTKGEELAQKFPNTFNHLRRDSTKITATALWADMEMAGITEADLPAMEDAVQTTGFAKIEQFKSYWK